jgi:adenylyl-sulfate kinase
MKNFRHIKFRALFWKSIFYRIISMTIFSSIFGYQFALFAGLIAFVVYYIYDWIFNKLFRITTEQGFVLWFTGLPCSGKSTLADIIAKKLAKLGVKVERLDGDIVRQGQLSNDLGFSKTDRDKNIRRVTFVSKILSRNGIAVLASFVSPYRKTRKQIKDSVTNFIEIFVQASPTICAKRDVKGMWKKAKAGQITGFTGWDNPYEIPIKANIICNTDKETILESADKILSYLRKRRLI